ncbi:Cyclic nucleotide-binding domain protein [Candidatus Magnetobacterium bavaricum]|uniref:Cyclic nucleotide-binding domain protein n=1 Tax=Candidatus Magnetobacterium bavaricum TaxID=29290 RepID=A0A0F3GVS9_9BACT|nr:Cyclic nucleotide-binding domain protein [Candidatus Magnetobacterium bavaricum]
MEKKGLNIIILNSDQRSQDFAKGSLNYLGYTKVIGVSKVNSLLNNLKSEKVDLLLADYNTIMKYDEGLLEKLRQSHEESPLRVILMIDSDINVRELKRMYREGVTSVLQYPFQMNDVEKAINDAVRSVPIAITKTVRKIRDLDFFSFLSDDELMSMLKICKCRKYKEGDIIFEEGEKPDRFYVIADGIIAITKGIERKREEVLARLRRGSCFGEMGILDGSPRSARAKAYDDVFLLEFDRRIMEGYDDILTLKLFKKLTQVFSRRLRGANNKIKELAIFAQNKKTDSHPEPKRL